MLNGSNRQNSPSFKQSEPQAGKNESPTCRTSGSDGQVGVEDQLLGGRILNQEELNHEQNEFSPELDKGSNRSKTASGSREESVGTRTSHGSCQGSPAIESTPEKDPSVSPIPEQCIRIGDSPELESKPTGQLILSATYSIADDALVTTEPQELFGVTLIEDAGSSKDLRNLCPSVADAIVEEQIPESSWINPPCFDLAPKQPMAALTRTIPCVTDTQEMKSVTIKATYRKDRIRFRISLTSGIMELKEEVAKRLKLEVGTFDIKYVDDDHEWVSRACDVDLQECLEISRSSGRNMIRQLVHDVMANLGSSYESTGELN